MSTPSAATLGVGNDTSLTRAPAPTSDGSTAWALRPKPLGPTAKRATLVTGLGLVGVAILLSPAALISFLRAEPGPHSSQLLLGAQFFRVGLATLGIVCAALP